MLGSTAGLHASRALDQQQQLRPPSLALDVAVGSQDGQLLNPRERGRCLVIKSNNAGLHCTWHVRVRACQPPERGFERSFKLIG